MIQNRSVPPDTVLPHVTYQNVDEAITWLTTTFGFSEHYRYGNPTSGAQMHLGNAWIMLRRARQGSASPEKLGYGTQSLTVFVDDLEAHCARSKAAGAKLVEECPRNRIWRTSIRGRRPRWPSLAVLAARSRPKSRRMGRHGRATRCNGGSNLSHVGRQ